MIGMNDGQLHQRLAGDVDRVVDSRAEHLHGEAAQAAGQAAAEDQPGQDGLGPDRLVNPVDRERRVGVDLLVAGLRDLLGRGQQLLGVVELDHQAVNADLDLFVLCVGAHAHDPPRGSVVPVVGRVARTCTSSCISETAIAGRNRTNRKMNVKNRPIVPMYVAQSQTVG